MANAIDAEWDRLGTPEVFTVIDYGAGPGTLARSVLTSTPRCLPHLRYIAVERSAAQRALHPEEVLSLDELSPEVIGNGVEGVVIANELLDNLTFTPCRLVDNELVPAEVVLDGSDLQTRFVSGFRPVGSETTHKSLVDQSEAVGWLADMLDRVLERGRVVVIDYARLASADVEVRTYASHGRAGDPLEQLGTKDITVDVDLEQLQHRVASAERVVTQAEWLGQHGIAALVEEGRQAWEASAAVGDLAALKARSRIREADALLAHDGLGGFLVAEWVV